MAERLLAYLFDRFRAPREVVLTSALYHVLWESEDVWSGFLSVADGAGGDLPRAMDLDEQRSSAEGGRPDLVGVMDDDTEVLLVELKLGAGLTERQPTGYLERLKPGRHGVLLFVVPRHRVTEVADEVVARLSAKLSATIARETLPSGALALSLADRRYVVVADWQTVIQRMRAAVARTDDARGVLSDIDQLEGLFEAMDEFIPFTEADLGEHVPTMLYQLYNHLVDLRERAVNAPSSPLHGHFRLVRERHNGNSWGFDMTMDGVPIRLHLHFDLWYNFGTSPLWLSIRAPERTSVDRLWEALEGAGIEPHEDRTDPAAIAVPLLAPVGVSEGESLTRLSDQLDAIRATTQAAFAGAGPLAAAGAVTVVPPPKPPKLARPSTRAAPASPKRRV